MNNERLLYIPKETPRQENVWQALEQFAANPILAEMLDHFGYEAKALQGRKANPRDILARRLKEMSIFCSTNPRLNPRGGKERNQASTPELTAGEKELILKTAESLGMIRGTQSPEKNYGGFVALGAGGGHAFERVAKLRETKNNDKTTEVFLLAGNISYTTAPIEKMGDLPPKENADLEQRRQEYIRRMLSLRDQYGERIPEFEFMLVAAETIYGQRQMDGTYSLGGRTERILESGDRAVTYPASDTSPRITILEAHKKSEKRVTSEDTFNALLKILPKNVANLLISTSALFVPFQDFIAKRILTANHDIDVDTIGSDMSRFPSFDKPEMYVQEITSAIIEAHKLADQLIRPTHYFKS